MAEIARIQLNAIRERVQANYKVPLEYTDRLLDHVVAQCRQSDAGARQINSMLSNTLLPTLAERMLHRLAAGGPLVGVKVDLDDGGGFTVQFGNSSAQQKKRRKRTSATG